MKCRSERISRAWNIASMCILCTCISCNTYPIHHYWPSSVISALFEVLNLQNPLLKDSLQIAHTSTIALIYTISTTQSKATRTTIQDADKVSRSNSFPTRATLPSLCKSTDIHLRVRTLTGKEIDLGKCSQKPPSPHLEFVLEAEHLSGIRDVWLYHANLQPFQISNQTTRSALPLTTFDPAYDMTNTITPGCPHQGASRRERRHTTSATALDLWRKANVRPLPPTVRETEDSKY